jgi:hypothetical protein
MRMHLADSILAECGARLDFLKLDMSSEYKGAGIACAIIGLTVSKRGLAKWEWRFLLLTASYLANLTDHVLHARALVGLGKIDILLAEPSQTR